MTIKSFRLTEIFFSMIILAALPGCEKQGQMLALREEFSKQLQTKDKAIDDLNQKINELRSENDQLQLQIAKNSTDPEKLTATVADAVAKREAEQNADMKGKIDQILQAVKNGGSVASGGNAGSTGRQAVPPAQRDPSVPSDPSRKRMRFDF